MLSTNLKRKFAVAALVAAALGGMSSAVKAAEEVNVYSYRQPFLIQPLFDAFTKESGIKVNTVFAKKGLIERLKQEGQNSPADLIFTVDIGLLTDVQNEGLTEAVKNDVIEANIPASYREPGGNWFGLTSRARLIFASKDRVKPGEIKNYEDLADPKWKGRICTRSGTHAYQVALTAAMIAHHGRDKAKTWLKGVKDNLARKPQGNDRDQVKAIMEGVCDISLGNNYYFGKMLHDEKQKPWADAVNLVFPNQEGDGAHVNVSGMALAKHAPNKAAAIKLMEFLSGDTAQSIYAEQNFEYPVKPGVAWSKEVEAWGRFKADTIGLAEVASFRGEAVKIANEVGYNE